jgi:hypothetical protein
MNSAKREASGDEFEAADAFEGARDFGQSRAQAAGGMQQDRVGRRCRHGHRRHDRQRDERAPHADGSLALGKNNCWPPIL